MTQPPPVEWHTLSYGKNPPKEIKLMYREYVEELAAIFKRAGEPYTVTKDQTVKVDL